jgi:hypothetical protein
MSEFVIVAETPDIVMTLPCPPPAFVSRKQQRSISHKEQAWQIAPPQVPEP